MEKNKLIIWGCSTHITVLEELLRENGYELVALFDRNENAKSLYDGIKIYHDTKDVKKLKEEYSENIYFAVAIAGENGKARLEVHESLVKEGLIPVDATHKNATISKSAKIMKGCQFFSGSCVTALAELGKCVIINTNASVDHQCRLGNGVHIGPGVTIAGLVEIGEKTFIGAGATVLPRIKIGKNVIIGAGSVVTKNIPDNSIAFGVPAKVIKENK